MDSRLDEEKNQKGQLYSIRAAKRIEKYEGSLNNLQDDIQQTNICTIGVREGG